jgi:hypothetical protein
MAGVGTVSRECRPNGRITMKYARIMLATIGLIAVGGAAQSAQADTTLYTPPTRGGSFHCDVVNVSQKPLNITISIVDGTATDKPPTVLNKPVAQTAMPGEEVNGNFGVNTDPRDAYCVIEVSGTGDRNHIRGALSTTLSRTFTVGADPTLFPTLVTREFEAH